MMQPIPGGATARPFVTHHTRSTRRCTLRIAPELYLKRLLVGGFERVYEMNRVFRNEGLSTRHNPEFTMLELYQAYANYRDLMTLTENLIRAARAGAHRAATTSSIRASRFDLAAKFAEIDDRGGAAARESGTRRGAMRDRTALAALCGQRGIEVRPEYGAGKLQFELFEKTVETHAARRRSSSRSYPAEVSPLARCNDADPFVTDRFELFIGGRELANGFSELNDPEEQAARFRAQVGCERRTATKKRCSSTTTTFARSSTACRRPQGLASASIGSAMLFTNSPSIRDVLLFPQLKPESPSRAALRTATAARERRRRRHVQSAPCAASCSTTASSSTPVRRGAAAHDFADRAPRRVARASPSRAAARQRRGVVAAAGA